ncbi:PEP-CTERM sorting domain-containing protein [Methylobacillus arboreus]|uniref:PEP-CTERM sorting domain-containing protein n=1 Tax=Methylobacillus arboreus TaxID=755170 RepID=UPI001E5E1158|nr:PEP-CTERM sorting domain-containing protein [Methylobacillus arboreus]MCB5190139.1 PEP-CTERM sorting domain-containing protein [Methylobacillus arboreus]
MRYTSALLPFAALLFTSAVYAGPFAPAAGQPGSTAIIGTDPSFVQWATGYESYLPGSNVDAVWKTPENALGGAAGTDLNSVFDIVTLGDGGQITLTFSGTIFNGAGYDFAVFENSFNDTFLELAYVEVSSDGLNFFRFPNYSFTPNPVGGYGAVDPTNIHNLAGKYKVGYGTPFDLDDLVGIDGLDVNAVSHVRIVDIVGDGSYFDSYPAEFGGSNPIYDPFPTWGSGGFDLDAVGVINFAAVAAVPEPSTYAMLAAGLVLVPVMARRRQRRRSAA